MLSSKLLRLIESHSAEIGSRLILAIRGNPNMATLAARPDIELKEWSAEILENLGALVSAPDEEQILRRCEALGRLRFEEAIPLHEAVLRYHILRGKIVGLVREQGMPMTALNLYAEEELDQRLGRVFDAMVYGLVRGYEAAMRHSVRLAG